MCPVFTVMGFKVASRMRGLSDEAFREAFGTEEQCRAALVRLRWPGGYVCPCCGHREHPACGSPMTKLSLTSRRH